MAVFNFGDPMNRRPPWHAAPMPGRPGAGGGIGSGSRAAVQPMVPWAAGSGPRVLVVDDNPLNRMLASEMLALWGIAPMLAADGSEAVAIARDHRLNLILMDLQMPVLGGLEATRQIRRLEMDREHPRVAIVAYTSTAFAPDPLRLQHLGLDGVLAKPCEAHALHACLLQWCPETRAAASADLAAERLRANSSAGSSA